MKTAFLTGATGFLGGHVARALAAQGWKVRALARPGSRRDELTRAGHEIVMGDLSSSTDLEAACRGCEAIVHVAGLVKARTLEDYRDVNLRGTEILLAAAVRASPEAGFLLVSSQAAAGPARGAGPVGESDPPSPVSWYGLSKLEGEAAVRRLWTGPWTVLRPGVVYGPGDRGLLVLFRAAARGLVPVPAPRSRLQIISAELAALAIARAASRRDLAGRTGFLCDPRPVEIARLCQMLASLPPRPARLLRLPDIAVRLAGAVSTLGETLTRRSLAFNADKAREILAGDWLCDSGPLTRDLDLPEPSDLKEGLSRTWQWYLDRGWLVL